MKYKKASSSMFQREHVFMMLKKSSALLIFLCMLTFCSCGPKTIGMSVADLPPAPATAPRTELAPGDQVEIRFAYSPEFNETQVIRPDGKLELLLLGEVDAAGKTPSRLRDELIKRYSEHLAHPELAVITRLSYDRRIYVGGAVNEPGELQLPGRLTAMEAIMQAGGFDFPSAEISNVLVIRLQDGKRRNYALNFNETFAGIDTLFPLEPRDIVYVPKTKIASVADWVDQNLWRIIPRFSTGYFWSTDVGD